MFMWIVSIPGYTSFYEILALVLRKAGRWQRHHYLGYTCMAEGCHIFTHTVGEVILQRGALRRRRPACLPYILMPFEPPSC